jgi:hypothetical protein
MNLNLIFALGWLVAAAAIFFVGDPRLSIRLPGLPPFSSAWLALLLALYNIARWWSRRSARRQRQAEREALAQRFQRHREEEGRPPVEPDPNFQFDDAPRPPEGGPT